MPAAEFLPPLVSSEGGGVERKRCANGSAVLKSICLSVFHYGRLADSLVRWLACLLHERKEQGGMRIHPSIHLEPCILMEGG
mmetsp:Transcript_25225/g.49284  ORF Transcript_25225/g.49284 Transcript_25225/m.49284 type:complete len:82 (+) Transcript_25225:2797-3042(+)